jgi:hypothetical protein
MRKRLEYEILLNCILIEEDIRKCFLFWCKKTLKVGDYIKRLFPNLILNKYLGQNKLLQLESSDVLLISKNIIQPEEYDNDAKLGNLLGYLSANNYSKLDRTIDFYNYVLVAKINNIEVYLYNELSQNKLDYQDIKNKVEIAFKRNKLGNNVDEVMIKELLVQSSAC